MASEWLLKAEYVKNCNCAPGCPCDFWAPPTHGPCQGMMAFHVLHGNYGKTKFDGVIFGGTYHWPAALHLGNGTLQPYLQDKSTPDQRDALLTIMSGKAGNAWFEVLASVVSKVLEPKFVPMAFDFDLEKRRAHIKFGDEVLATTEPLHDIALNKEHRIRLEMPNGMEYKHPEIATVSVLRSTGAIAFDCAKAHSSLAMVEQTHRGLIA